MNEVAEEVQWHKAKITTYLSREKESGWTKNLIPKPSIFISNRPFWTAKQIKKFKEQMRQKNG